MQRKPERMFVVRIWWEPSSQGDAWRASLTNANNQQRHYFGLPDDLARFLLQPNPSMHESLEPDGVSVRSQPGHPEKTGPERKDP